MGLIRADCSRKRVKTPNTRVQKGKTRDKWKPRILALDTDFLASQMSAILLQVVPIGGICNIYSHSLPKWSWPGLPDTKYQVGHAFLFPGGWKVTSCTCIFYKVLVTLGFLTSLVWRRSPLNCYSAAASYPSAALWQPAGLPGVTGNCFYSFKWSYFKCICFVRCWFMHRVIKVHPKYCNRLPAASSQISVPSWGDRGEPNLQRNSRRRRRCQSRKKDSRRVIWEEK